MWVLGIETSGMAGSVALTQLPTDAQQADPAISPPLWRRDLPADQRSAQTLAPAIQALLADAGCAANEIGLVAACAGPGSFTGLRVGVGTAKAFAYAVQAQTVGVDTLDVLAHQAPLRAGQAVWAILNAQRGELFAACYRSGLESLKPGHIVSVEKWLADLKPGQMVIGPPLEKLGERLPPHVEIPPKTTWLPDATTVVRLACAQWLAVPVGVSFDPFNLLPTYLRRVAAEEQWERRHA